MTDTYQPFVALVGFKRSRAAVAGGTRVLVARDGVVRIVGKDGTADFEAPVPEITARLTKGRVVELKRGSESVVVYGIPEMVRIPRELRELVDQERVDAEFVGQTKVGFLGVFSPKNVKRQAAASRAVAEALHERGAGQA